MNRLLQPPLLLKQHRALSIKALQLTGDRINRQRGCPLAHRVTTSG